MLKEYRICSKTVMDTISDPDITFDENGICNYYYEFSDKIKIRVPPPEIAERELKDIGRRMIFDCKIIQCDFTDRVLGGKVFT